MVSANGTSTNGINGMHGADKKLEVLIVGYGAVGVLYGYVLKQSGLANVSAVARSDYQVVKEHGTTIKSQKFGTIPNFKPDRLFRSPEEIPEDLEFDYILCCFKCLPDFKPSADIIRPYLRPNARKQPCLVLMQNGIGIEHPVQQAFPDIHIISVSIWIAANLLEGGRLLTHTDVERLVMGLYTGEQLPLPPLPEGLEDVNQVFPPSSNPFSRKKSTLLENVVSRKVVFTDERVQEGRKVGKLLADTLIQGGANISFVDNIQAERWGKNLWNVVFNTACCLSRLPVSKLLTPITYSEVIPPLEATMKEAVEVGAAMGYTHASGMPMTEVMIKAIQIASTPSGDFKPSTLIDLENGKPMELEVIIGGVVERAHILQIEVPRLELMYSLMRVNQYKAIQEAMGQKY